MLLDTSRPPNPYERCLLCNFNGLCPISGPLQRWVLEPQQEDEGDDESDEEDDSESSDTSSTATESEPDENKSHKFSPSRRMTKNSNRSSYMPRRSSSIKGGASISTGRDAAEKKRKREQRRKVKKIDSKIRVGGGTVEHDHIPHFHIKFPYAIEFCRRENGHARKEKRS